ncbi:MAG: hypothetical protein HYX74_10810 [Acidobacteria bacterium]|nr:hypothetical protein [Acidobacteriota bacterium]
MPLTTEQLKQGISYWRGANWPKDFHNEFYRKMAAVSTNGGFNQEWWVAFSRVLRSWKATRPRGHAFLSSRVQARFEALTKIWQDVVAPHLDNDIGGLEWYQIGAFPSLVGEIKDVASPVFSSKFCHFLAPRIFPVVDNAAMGNPFRTYEAYFTTGRAEWLGTDPAIQDELVGLLTDEVAAPLFGGFPVKCKLIVGKYRVFYDIDDNSKFVMVRAVRHKPAHKTTEDIL